MTTRSLVIVNAAALIALIALIALPSVGLFLVALALIVLPPWGRTYAERAVITGLILVGVIAIVFPRAGSISLDRMSATALFGGLLMFAMLLRVFPRVASLGMPRFNTVDAIVGLTTVLVAAVPIKTFFGLTSEQMVASLFQTGWDNQGHFVPFANTVTQGGSQWVAADGSIAWNQWYPAVHTNLWSLGQVVVGSETPDRISLVIPYALWVALSFAACVGVFTWIAGDLAKVLARKAQFSNKGVNTAGIFAALGVALFGIFGSIQYLYSAGFTNFIMAVAVVAATSYLSAKKPESFGWFVLPLGALATVGLWTPLVVGLVPAGIVIAIKLIRVKIWWGILWLVGVSAIALVTLISQADAVLGASDAESTGDFNEALSSVGVGMTGFNLTLAMFAPLIAAFIGISLWRRGLRVLAILLSAPVILSSGLAVIFMVGADSTGVSRLTSYYVLKSLNASLLLLIPVLAALGAIGLVLVVRHLGKLNAVFISVTVFVVGVSTFGFIGFNANQLAANFEAAPGIKVALERDKWINQPEIGERIVQAARVAQRNPDFTPIAWEGVGALENLWVLGLTNVASYEQTIFYRELPEVPYGELALAEITQYTYANPTSRIQLMWTSPEVGQALQQWAASYPPERILTPEVVIP
jgi:hypothetical protein